MIKILQSISRSGRQPIIEVCTSKHQRMLRPAPPQPTATGTADAPGIAPAPAIATVRYEVKLNRLPLYTYILRTTSFR